MLVIGNQIGIGNFLSDSDWNSGTKIIKQYVEISKIDITIIYHLEFNQTD